MRLIVSIAILLAIATPATAQLATQTQGLAGAGTFEAVPDFGGNPGVLNMYRYVPSPDPGPGAPLVVALHACSQNATAYRNAGWEPLADEYGFYVIYPEQTPFNNGAGCFNWAGEFGNGANIPRGDGENQSIKTMVDFMLGAHGIDAARVFTTGHSGGGAQSALMLATWPDVFAGGAMIAGVPYDCTRNFNQVSACLNPGLPRAANVWGDLVRAAFPGFQGTYPKVSVWHGTADFSVAPANGDEMVKQWTNVHGLGEQPDATEMVDGHSRKIWRDGDGQVVVEQYEIQDGGHGTFVDPDSGCGTAAAFFLDNNICSALRIAQFFGLTDEAPAPGDMAPPTVSITAPIDGATVMGNVTLTATAMDDVGVASVEFLVAGDVVGAAASEPWQVVWDASAVPTGEYTIRAIARDAAGNTGDAEVMVHVQSDVVDDTPPTVVLTAPAQGAEVRGATRIEATAMDDNSVARVVFRVDEAVIGEAVAVPYGVAWDSALSGVGPHTVRATAIDAAGNQASAEAMITVGEPPAPGVVPQVRLISPAVGSEVRGVATLKIDATSASEVSPVVLFWVSPDAGEVAIGTDYRGPDFEFLWDVGAVPEGPQTLIARAFDADNHVGMAQFELVVSHAAPVQGEGGMGGGEGGADGGVGGEGGEGGEEPRRAGRSYWGCTQAPRGSDASWLWLVLVGGLIRRRRALSVAAVALALSTTLTACEGDPIYVYVGAGDAGPVTEPEPGAQPAPEGGVSDFNSVRKVESFLEGKTLLMAGANLCSHPNGFDANANMGQATQCYSAVELSVLAGRWTTRSVLGALQGASDVGDVGVCDTDVQGAPLEFASTAVLIANVAADGSCFDVTSTYPGFGQEGRGRIVDGGATVLLEFYFKDTALGHRCADGAVGDTSNVRVNDEAFNGDAVQVYAVSDS
ncbi:MAG: poly(hydroxyalkanoate) depolymerase family esterase [Bradymonadia bacterium]|jgi:poly(hydroxyalkanoate) depolymerase family esterase